MRACFFYSLIVLAFLGAASGQDTNFSTGPQYLMISGSPMFARPISTPSMSLAGAPLEVGADNATGVLIAGAETQTMLPPSAVALPRIDLFPIFYGNTAVINIPVNDIEISLPQASAANNIPASISETGVWQVTTIMALRERGYGVTLPEAAAFGKMRHHATRLYTNADIDRLHHGNS